MRLVRAPGLGVARHAVRRPGRNVRSDGGNLSNSSAGTRMHTGCLPGLGLRRKFSRAEFAKYLDERTCRLHRERHQRPTSAGTTRLHRRGIVESERRPQASDVRLEDPGAPLSHHRQRRPANANPDPGGRTGSDSLRMAGRGGNHLGAGRQCGCCCLREPRGLVLDRRADVHDHCGRTRRRVVLSARPTLQLVRSHFRPR